VGDWGVKRDLNQTHYQQRFGARREGERRGTKKSATEKGATANKGGGTRDGVRGSFFKKGRENGFRRKKRIRKKPFLRRKCGETVGVSNRWLGKKGRQ